LIKSYELLVTKLFVNILDYLINFEKWIGYLYLIFSDANLSHVPKEITLKYYNESYMLAAINFTLNMVRLRICPLLSVFLYKSEPSYQLLESTSCFPIIVT